MWGLWCITQFWLWIWFFCGAVAQLGPQASSFFRFLCHIHTYPVGILRTSDQLVAEAALYTTHNKHTRQASVSSAAFEPAILAIERFQTCGLDHIASEVGDYVLSIYYALCIYYYVFIMSTYYIFNAHYGVAFKTKMNKHLLTNWINCTTFQSEYVALRLAVLRCWLLGTWTNDARVRNGTACTLTNELLLFVRIKGVQLWPVVWCLQDSYSPFASIMLRHWVVQHLG